MLPDPCSLLDLADLTLDLFSQAEQIVGAVDYQYFFGAQSRPVPGYRIHAPSWADVERLIGTSLAGRPG